jgi:hypothetical protein
VSDDEFEDAPPDVVEFGFADDEFDVEELPVVGLVEVVAACDVVVPEVVPAASPERAMPAMSAAANVTPAAATPATASAARRKIGFGWFERGRFGRPVGELVVIPKTIGPRGSAARQTTVKLASSDRVGNLCRCR